MSDARASPFPARTSQEHAAVTTLQTPVLMIYNLREKGKVHRVANASRFVQRDKRRSVCGWRAGGAISSVRFCATKVWPPQGLMAMRICSKCFPCKPMDSGRCTTNDDTIQDYNG